MKHERFILKTDFSPEGAVVFENLGLVIYTAQLFDLGLQNTLTGLERLGAIKLPDDCSRSNDGFIDSCLGEMIHILLSRGSMDHASSRLLKKARRQRNILAHRLMTENLVDMLNHAGRESVNRKLKLILTDLSRAIAVVDAINKEVWRRLGHGEDKSRQQIEEFKRLSDCKDDGKF